MRCNIKTVGFLLKKVASSFQLVEDDLGFNTPGLYCIPWERGKIYIGQTGCCIETRIKEHYQHTRLYHLDTSVMTEYSINLCNHMQAPFQ